MYKVNIYTYFTTILTRVIFSVKKRWLYSGPFCENYAKLSFDAAHLEKRLNMGW